VGAGPRSALLDSRRDSCTTGRQARRCVRPRLGARGEEGDLATASSTSRRHQRGGRRAEGAGNLSVTSINQHVRDAMVPEPGALDVTASAQKAGERLSDPAVRAVLVVDDGKLVGVITRKTLVSQVVA